MRLAVVDQTLEEPKRGARDAVCQGCGQPVIAKIGTIVSPHWAHKAGIDCDPWAEPDSAWHRSWQEIVPRERREVSVGNHRADIVALDGTVVELQHSAISPLEIRARERHYGRMVWIFDVTEAVGADRLLLRRRSEDVADMRRTFRWKHSRRSLVVCRQPVLLDWGADHLLRLEWMSGTAPTGGKGYLVPRDRVVGWMS